MTQHGDSMNDLLWSVLFLDYDSALSAGMSIVEGPRLSRIHTGDASVLNNRIPPIFFDLQDELVDRTKKLLVAAKNKDIQALGRSYGKITETCVRCHDAYLQAPPTHDALLTE